MRTAELTKRECEVAELLAWGQTKKEVADRLFISYYTVDNHTKNIFQKTGVSSVNGLSAWWFCTRFKISFDLSPLKRAVVAGCLLLCVLPREMMSDQDTFRVRQGRTRTSVRARRGRRSRRERDFIAEF